MNEPTGQTRVTITAVSVAHPPYRIDQAEAARQVGDLLGEQRRARALARGTSIEGRCICIPPSQVARLGSIADRNRLYMEVAPGLALQAAEVAVAARAGTTGCLVTSSCTGYMVPGWDVALALRLGLPCDSVRLPITQAGCSGGVLAMARAADYVRLHPGTSALAVSCELCSLAFQTSPDEGTLTSNLIFGDGAGAALLSSRDGDEGLEIADSMSFLEPAPERTLGFDLTDTGFSSVLSRQLVDVVPPATGTAVGKMLAGRGLLPRDVGFWLLHPGGARLLTSLERSLGLDRCRTRWAWESMAEFGNTSSAAVFDVLRRYLADPAAPGGWGVVAAFGPGISIELLLVRRC
jgi:alkylresorcinol/alkylpyrone synthase